MQKTAILDEDQARHKWPWDLTDQEVFQLMQAFTRDKCVVTEDDCLTLCHWAQAHKRSATVLALVLAGRVRVAVEGGVVTLGLPV
jgi:hypothetical protein